MQAKGIVKFFLVLLLLICASQFIYYFPTNKVENAANAKAKAAAAMASPENRVAVEKATRIAYLDSMSSEKVFNIPLLGSYTYQELKSKQLALGLDLKGGMSVLLQVDLQDFLRSMSGNNADANFVKALDDAKKAQQQSQGDYISLFVQEYKKTAGEGKLASLFARNESLKGSIDIQSSDNKVYEILRARANETVKETFDRLKLRIDKLGVVQPNVSLDASRDMIVVELPGIENSQRARAFLQQAAKLEFWEVYRISDPQVATALMDADKTLKAQQAGIKPDSTNKVDTSAAANMAGPLFNVLSPNSGNLSPAIIGMTEKNKRDIVMSYLKQPEIAAKFPRELVFTWSKDPMPDKDGKSTGIYELYALKKSIGKDGPALDGERVTDARAQSGEKGGSVEVSLQMDNTGSAQWAALTTQCAQDNNREVAIVLDNDVVSAPRVINPITGGRSSITGNYTVQEASDLSSILRVGKLPARPEIVQENTVGPSLGAENIKSSLVSIGVAFLAIMAFMAIYYSTGGIISIIALIANLFFIIGMLTSKGTVLTLPGIAGIVLTMGMAVDANVIIYERIREELAEGKGMLQAISEGFKNSYNAIIDGNVTTLITALILWYYGLGPIKGFGIVLAIGILFTLFTAVLLTHLIVDYWTGKGKEIKFFAPFSERAFKSINFDWMNFRFKAYGISLAIILAGVVSFFMRDFEYGVEFKGGFSYNVKFDKPVQAETLRDGLTKAFGESTIVKAVSNENTFNITTSYKIREIGEKVQDEVNAKLFEGLNTVMGGSMKMEEFLKSDGNTTHIISQSKVGPTIADDIKNSAFWATIMGILGIGAYILLRFNRWQYSLGGIVALFHDVLITLAFFTLFHGIFPFSMEMDSALIAALLTIVGYSINDTVIVYDRIREYMKKYSQKPMATVINDAINSTLSRTIITSTTVLLVIFILFLFGGSSIKGFSFALLVGVLAGTYSSIFIASPIMMDFSKNLDLSEYKPEVTEGSAAKKKAVKEKA